MNKTIGALRKIYVVTPPIIGLVFFANLPSRPLGRKYDCGGNPVFGMRFMYLPTNAKLIYSRGRIFLIFAHFNDFKSDGEHTGDTVVTFNDYLLDMDFGVTWGASHSLI